jgi:hypothetical protein
MTIFKRKSDSKLYIIYKNVDGSLTAFPQGKVLDQSDILNKCKLEDFVVFKIENNTIKGFI